MNFLVNEPGYELVYFIVYFYLVEGCMYIYRLIHIPPDEKRESPHGGSPVSEVKLEPRNDPSSIIQSVVAVKHQDFPIPPAGKKQRCRDYDGM